MALTRSVPKEPAYIGIDPGAQGYLCWLVPSSMNPDRYIEAKETPTKIYQWITHISRNYDLRAIMIEEVHSIFGMSAKSNFSFGWNVGELHTILKLTQIGYDMVQPKAWQKEIGIKFPPKAKPAAKKKISAEVATRLYPKADIFGPQGGLKDGKSDALMIAHYAMLKYAGAI